MREIDITNRFSGHAQTANPFEDTSLQWETSGRMLDNIVVAMAGASAERTILGEHTSGCDRDYDNAVGIALHWMSVVENWRRDSRAAIGQGTVDQAVSLDVSHSAAPWIGIRIASARSNLAERPTDDRSDESDHPAKVP